jgi:hypothetical protein
MYQWDLTYNQEDILLSGKTADFTFLKAGWYTVTLTVFDQSGNTGNTDFIVTVLGAGNLEGLVTCGGEPVVAAECKLTFDDTREVTLLTDQEGRFNFTDIPTGPVHLKIKKEGHVTFEGDFNIPAVGTESIDPSLLILKREEKSDVKIILIVILIIALVISIFVSVIVFLAIRNKKKAMEKNDSEPDEGINKEHVEKNDS